MTLELAPLPPAVVTGLVHYVDEAAAFDLAAALRNAAATARERDDRAGPDVRAIEWLDSRCLGLLRQHGDAKSRRVSLPDEARAALLFEMELDEPTDDDRADKRERAKGAACTDLTNHWDIKGRRPWLVACSCDG